MIATKKNWLKRTLSLLLAFVMLLSISILNVFAVDTDELPTGYKRAVQLKAPAEDGVYYADIDLRITAKWGKLPWEILHCAAVKIFCKNIRKIRNTVRLL